MTAPWWSRPARETSAANHANSADVPSIAKVEPFVWNINLSLRLSATGHCKAGDIRVLSRPANRRRTRRSKPTTPMHFELPSSNVKLTVTVSEKALAARFAPEPSV